MQTVEEAFPFTTAEDSVLAKDWAAGSSEISDSRDFLISRNLKTGVYSATYSAVKYPPALLKIIDEPIVNALDHVVRCIGSSKPVTTIKISLDATGRVRIYNNGAGISVVEHKVASEALGRKTWLPTLIFGTLFQGSNRDNKDSIIGGTNGLGGKLANIFGSEFAIETCDGKHYFLQKFEKNKTVEHPPLILPVNDPKVPAAKREEHTVISYIPDYTGVFKYAEYDEKLHDMLTDLVRTRVFMAAAYARYTTKCDVWFNNERIPVQNIGDIAAILFPNCTRIVTISTPTSPAPYTYYWEVCAVITDCSKYDTAQLSNVNGVVAKDGKHTRKIMDCTVAGVREAMEKLFKGKSISFSPKYVTSSIFLLINAKIPNAHWNGQRKDVLDINMKHLAGYSLDSKFIAGVADAVRAELLDHLLQPAKQRTKAVDIEKYKPANKAGKKGSQHCAMWCVEGDSAFDQCANGISKNLGYDHNGIFSLGGVGVNTRKQCTITQTSAGQRRVIMSKMLTKNVRFNAMMQALGLDINATYDPNSPTYKTEMARLQYGCIIMCVDQDLDGKGNILGLILNTFDLLWPNLINAGFVKWFPSPIIRLYPKAGGRVLEFYTVSDHKNWEATGDPTKYTPKYLKGLGSNSPTETVHMYKNGRDKVVTFYNDERSHDLFEIYFGTKPDLRKKKLSDNPPEIPGEVVAEQLRTRRISCSVQLETETDEYQRDNLDRKLDHVIDGQNQAGRKILDGLIKAFGTANKPQKVSQLAGIISGKEDYHHAEASLAQSVRSRGFVAVGGKQIPIIVPDSEFGSRLRGGAGAADPRYIWCTLNKRAVELIFPPADYPLLAFPMGEGQRTEPEYFIPTIPMAALESTEVPGHGWKLQTWGRDVFKVIENVRRLIRISDDAKLLEMPPARCLGAPHEWKGEFRYAHGALYAVGRYYIEDDTTVIITELPLRVWSNQYIDKLKARIAKAEKEKPGSCPLETAKDIACDDTQVRIMVKFKPGIIETLEGDAYIDGVEEFLKLRVKLTTHLNMMMPGDRAGEFSGYGEIISYWFPYRKQLYADRIARERELMRLDIVRLENIVRYLSEAPVVKGLKRAEMMEKLEKLGYVRMNAGVLQRPKFTPTADLEAKIMRGKKSTYAYIVGLSDLDKSEESVAEYRAKLAEARAKLAEFDELANSGRFPGAAIWESELDKLEDCIREGLATSWHYGDAGKYQFD